MNLGKSLTKRKTKPRPNSTRQLQTKIYRFLDQSWKESVRNSLTAKDVLKTLKDQLERLVSAFSCLWKVSVVVLLVSASRRVPRLVSIEAKAKSNEDRVVHMQFLGPLAGWDSRSLKRIERWTLILLLLSGFARTSSGCLEQESLTIRGSKFGFKSSTNASPNAKLELSPSYSSPMLSLRSYLMSFML